MADPTPQKDIVFLAKGNFRGSEKFFGLRGKDRRQHVYVVGKTGTGKTTLLKNMVLQDIRAGNGVGIIDPHGEFVESVLEQIPASRTNDVIYFNPVDAEYPIGFNVLEVSDPKYKHLVVSDLLGIFTKIWANVWSPRMEYILQNCIMALLDTPGTTLLGIPRILVDKDYRQKIVANVKDPVVRSFWIHEYETWRDQFRNEAIVPIQNKVNQFLNTSFIRNIVGQAKSTLNVQDVMNEGKILLVNVSKGRVGEDNSALLGAMIITKVQLAAMERVRIKESERRDFYLYVDEFQNFATDSFASILSEARKYRLNITIAHQYIGQLVTDQNKSTRVRDAVFGNVGTMILFRVGAADAEFLEVEFAPEFIDQDLINLPNFNIYLKLMVDGITSRPFSATTIPAIHFETDPDIRDKIIRVSRERFSRPRAEVEDKIARWSGMVGEQAGEDANKTFETVCWNCGKTATVPFKPDGKRPVYCSSCLNQIEEGKLIPLPDRMPKVGREKYSSTLGDLGIEFDAGPARQTQTRTQTQTVPRPEARRGVEYQPRRQERREERRDERPRRELRPAPSLPGVRSQPVVRTSPDARPISLSSLKQEVGEDRGIPRQQKNASPLGGVRPQAAAQSSELKKVLQEALEAKEAMDKKPPENPEKSENPEKKNENSKTNVIKPGDTIRF